MQALAVSLYRLLLVLFLPRTLRDAHGDEMSELYSDSVAEASRSGRLNALKAAIRGMLDVAGRAPHEHWRRSGPIHSQNKEHPVQSLLIDVRQAFRSFLRQRSATLLIVGTLTLAVAANITVFALLDGVFRRPLPFPNANQLVYMNERAPKWNLEYTNINYPDFVAWRERAKAFQSMSLYGFANVNVGEGAAAERVRSLLVTHDFATTLGIRPTLGRTFTAAEDVPNGPNVVMLSQSFWKNQYNGDSAIVGKVVRINSTPFTVIGVLPAEAAFPDNTAIWTPLRGNPDAQGESYSYDGIGRLKDGVTIDQALQSLNDAHAPIWAARDTAHTVSPRLEPIRDRLVSDFRAAGMALGIAAALVLCIACANVAGTMLARSIARRYEIGIRVALGASGNRIVRLLLTESLLLSAMAGAIGSAVAYVALGKFDTIGGIELPVWSRPHMDMSAVLFSVAVVTVSALVFGLAPALQLRRHVATANGTATSRMTGSVPERRLLSALVVSEVALAAVLLICGGLLLKAYSNMRNTSPGFRADGLVTFRMSLPDTYSNAVSQLAVYTRVLERVRALPRVDHAGAITCLPLTCHNGNFFAAENGPPRDGDIPDPVVNVRTATHDYFATMGISLKKGRLFREGEGNAGKNGRVAVINDQFAKGMWPNDDPIGKRFAFSGDTSRNWITVVGVVEDVRHYGLAKPMIPGIYLSTTALDSTDNLRSFGFAIHAGMGADELVPLVRAAVRDVVPDIPVFELRTMQSALDQSMSQQRLITMSLMTFAAVALGLAMGGIYAVLSYVVGRRRREIAIRMAVGAQSKQVLRLVMRQGLTLTVIGLAIGVPVAAVGARGLNALLLGVSPSDTATYLLAAGLLVLVGSIAATIPALRASRLEPKSILNE